jgi:hypothetical protein
MATAGLRVAGNLRKALDTIAGMKRQAQMRPGYMLFEDTRPTRQEWRSRFVVRPHDPGNVGDLMLKGFHLLATGEPGADLNPEPLLRKAAENPDLADRREELLAAADQCAENVRQTRNDTMKKKPTAEERQAAREFAQTKAIEEGISAALGPAMERMAEAMNAVTKRGPGRPKKSDEE